MKIANTSTLISKIQSYACIYLQEKLKTVVLLYTQGRKDTDFHCHFTASVNSVSLSPLTLKAKRSTQKC